MKKLIYSTVLVCFALAFTACDKEPEHTAVPIAPLLKEIVMPLESNTIPGTNAKIDGKGFESTDIIRCTSVGKESIDFTAKIVEVTDYAVTIAIPAEAAGPYEVEVERGGLITKLDARLNVAYVIPIQGIELPTANVKGGDVVTVKGTGYEAGDKVVFSSEAYPGNHTLEVEMTMVEGGASFTVPASCYGVNKVTVVRGKRQTALGNLKIAVAVGDLVGGGVVYYVSDEGTHGLIANKENVGSATEQWGPTTSHGDTSLEIYSGKENTRICVEAMKDFHQRFDTWPLTKKSAAEMCDELTVTVDEVVYDDWFLPSLNEMVELCKVYAMMWDKDAGLVANNYWTSSQGVIDGDAGAPHWSAFYVNFYEPEKLITGPADKEGWKIGIRPVRQF